MTSHAWPPYLYIGAIVFLTIDILLGLLYFVWVCKKRHENKKKANNPDKSPLLNIKMDPFTTNPTRDIDYSPDIFEIPCRKISVKGNERNLRLKKYKTIRRSTIINQESFDIEKYQKHSIKRKMSSIPRLCFELFYDFRTSEIMVSLKVGKYLPEYINEQIVVSVLMSHCFTIYHTARVDGPNPTFNEDLRFPLDSMHISSDPPITLKFNVWTIDRYSRKNPFGYVEVSIEEIFTQQGVTPAQGQQIPYWRPLPGMSLSTSFPALFYLFSGKMAMRRRDKRRLELDWKGIVWRNVLRSDSLTDESLQGDVLISLSYLPGAQRISLILDKAKDLVLSATDKDVQGKITLLYRDVEQKVFYSTFVPMTTNPKFSQEFVFCLSEFKNVNIDGIAISVELLARQVKRLMKTRVIGKFTIGKSGLYERSEQEHWAAMLTAKSSTFKWHSLQSCE